MLDAGLTGFLRREDCTLKLATAGISPSISLIMCGVMEWKESQERQIQKPQGRLPAAKRGLKNTLMCG